MSRATLCDWTQASELIADRESCVMVWRTFCDSASVSDAGWGGREGGWGGVAASGVLYLAKHHPASDSGDFHAPEMDEQAANCRQRMWIAVPGVSRPCCLQPGG